MDNYPYIISVILSYLELCTYYEQSHTKMCSSYLQTMKDSTSLYSLATTFILCL